MSAKGRRVVIALAALAGIALTARLGVWQLDRAAQKVALQQAQDERRALPPLPAAELARGEAAALGQFGRAIVVEGRWNASQTVFLDNRQMGGKPGFFVVTPLVLADGSAVAVQRGWQARDFMDRTKVVLPPTPEGVVRLQGRIAPSPGRLFDFGGAASGPIRQNLDLAAYAAETGLRLRPLSIVQTGPEGPADDGLLRDWPRPAADVQKHYGYAFQWFALASLILGLYVWFQLLRPRRR